MTATEGYRPDIDGLRALSILAVIGFHAFPQWVPGGFVGVDVFFVVSGYLISQQLFAAADRHAFSFADFYVRRLRRILPALLLVLVATAIFGWVALSPREYAGLQTHLAASAFFANNFVLWNEAGYFDQPSATKPLLHLWSLGVEEQFYIVWPWLIWWSYRRGLRRTAVIGISVSASFLLSVALVANGYTSAAFFLPHSRLWQIGAGAWLAAYTATQEPLGSPMSRWLFLSPTERDAQMVNNGLAIAGLALLGLAVIALGQGPDHPNWWADGPHARMTEVIRFVRHALALGETGSIYPGWPAMLPTAGAVLIVAAGPAAFANRTLLSLKALVFIGLISYPLYLWHWPILSFLQITEQGQVPPALIGKALALAFGLATVTYLFVERPIRSRISTRTPWRAVALACALGMIGLVMVGAHGAGALLPPLRVPVAVDQAGPTATNESACRAAYPVRGGYCQMFLGADLPVTTALIGDSHAAQFFVGLGSALAAQHENLVQFGDVGCPPLMRVERVNETGGFKCADVNASAYNAINAAVNLQHVVVAFRGGIYEAREAAYGATPIRVTGESVFGEDAVEAGLTTTVATLLEHHKRVTLVLPVPALDFEIGECVGRPWSIAPRQRRSPCAVAKSMVLTQQATFRTFVDRLKATSKITVVDPVDALCDRDFCFATVGGQPLYSDNNHLGVAGSMQVAPIFSAAISPAGRPGGP
jgi:peptidoglycan/LPS O-acetylase OafA/YrhL